MDNSLFDEPGLDADLLALFDTQIEQASDQWKTFLVLEIYHQDDQDTLQLFSESDRKEVLLHVRQDWRECRMKTGTEINVHPDTFVQYQDAGTGDYVVDNDHNFIIVHPNRLISGSRVSSSINCLRRSVISEKVSSLSIHAQKGIMAHELFQTCIKSEDFTDEYIGKQSQTIVKASYSSLTCFEDSEASLVGYLTSLAPQLQSWAECYYRGPRSEQSTIMFGGSSRQTHISEVIDIEDQIWAPKYGLQGKLDATVRVCRSTAEGEGMEQGLLPLELKTGKPYITDNAQLALYTLLLSGRYGGEALLGQGLLLYITPQSTYMGGVINGHREFRSLLIKRNMIASYLDDGESLLLSGSLPPMIQDGRQCKRCFQKDACMIYRRTYEPGSPCEIEDETGHLSQASLDYFDFWNRMIDLSSREGYRLQTEIWNEPSHVRQSHGRCIAEVMIKEEKRVANDYLYRFEPLASAPNTVNFTDLYFEVGDKAAISTEYGQTAIAMGFVYQVHKRSVTIRICKKPIAKRYIGSKFRIDKDEFMSGFAKLRGSLVSLFHHHPESQRKRRLIVDLSAPQFLVSWNPDTIHPTLQNKFHVTLNDGQRNAIKRIMAAQDYALVLGMPGTGKTTLIVFLIQLLVSLSQSVLVVCHTNSSLDNILLKLDEEGVPFVRCGTSNEKIPTKLRPYMLNQREFKSLEDARQFCRTQMVVGSTCLGVSTSLLGGRRFDVVIADESSQATQAVMLLPLQLASRFVLVGDHYQLPPLVKDPFGRESGMDISLFLRLSEAHPQAVSQLYLQYRMSAPILLLCNELVYSYALKCGSEAVANATIVIPNPDKFPSLAEKYVNFPEMDWIKSALELQRKVVFLDTDLIPAPESLRGEQNQFEAEIVIHLLYSLISSGFSPNDIGVISPYRSQIRRIRHLATSLQVELDIDSVDKFQGKDKSCIIISFVRSNDKNRIGEILQDWRRINVAVSRAKHKLILIGSPNTLRESPIMNSLLAVVRREQWMMTLPCGALEAYENIHAFSGGWSQGEMESMGTLRLTGAAELSQSRKEELPSKRAKLDVEIGMEAALIN